MGVIGRSDQWLDALADYLSRESCYTTDKTVPYGESTVEGLHRAAREFRGAVEALRIAREYVAASDLRQSSIDLAIIDAALGRMAVIWHDDAAVIDFIDAWAHDYANDAWRDLSAEDQMSEGRRIVDAATTNLRGELDRLRAQQAESLESVRQAWDEVARLRATSGE